MEALVDSGATRNIMSEDCAKRVGVPLTRKTEPYFMGTLNKTDYVKVQFQTKPFWIRSNEHKERIVFDIMKTQREVYLGIPWLTLWNPKIEWTSMRVKIGSHLLSIPKRLAGMKKDCDAFTRKWQTKTEVAATDEVPQLFKKFQDVLKEPEGGLPLPAHTQEDHEIIITDPEKLKAGPIYGLNDEQSKVLRQYIDHNLKRGYIRHSKSRTGQPVMFVPKKSGDLRLCVDFRRLNAVTQKDKYPLPLLADLKSRIGKARWFTKLDLRDAFNLLRIKHGDEWKTAFRTKYGLFEYLVMPFGLTNAPATLQQAVNKALYDYLNIFVIVYMDDVLIFSETREEHDQHIHKVLQRFREYNLRVKEEKSEFFKQEVTFLGYVIKPGSIAMEANKLQAIKEWPTPKNKKDIQSYLGFTGFYQNMTGGYAKKTVPLTDLLRNDTTFKWTRIENEAFKKLKQSFANEEALGIFDPDEQVVLYTDASDRALGSCIVQKGRPLGYYSRKLTPAEVNYTTTDKEMLAIVASLVYWKIYTSGTAKRVIVYTDHKNLLSLLLDKELNQRQMRRSEEITHYDFEIRHIKGTDNTVADTLSRRADYEATAKTSRPLLKRNGEVLERAEASEEISDIIRQAHNPRTSGHQGITKTLRRIQEKTNMPVLKRHVEEYIKNCPECSMSKKSKQGQVGKLHPTQTPEQPYQ